MKREHGEQKCGVAGRTGLAWAAGLAVWGVSGLAWGAATACPPPQAPAGLSQSGWLGALLLVVWIVMRRWR